MWDLHERAYMDVSCCHEASRPSSPPPGAPALANPCPLALSRRSPPHAA